MLQTLHFVPRPLGFCQRVLGVIASKASAAHDVHFSVPAHVLITLNVVLQGTLMQGDQILPQSFATGAHTRSRRYQLSAGASLLTLFCRADAALDLAKMQPAELTDRWLAAHEVFTAWKESPARTEVLQCANAMLSSVNPKMLPVLNALNGQNDAQRMTQALQALMSQDIAAAAQSLHMSERSLQRLFLAQWGISPKLVQRMLRVQRCVNFWQSKGENLAQLASQAGLTDQAHLAREFRQLVGYAPCHLKRTASSAHDDTLWALRTGHTLLAPLLTQ